MASSSKKEIVDLTVDSDTNVNHNFSQRLVDRAKQRVQNLGISDAILFQLLEDARSRINHSAAGSSNPDNTILSRLDDILEEQRSLYEHSLQGSLFDKVRSKLGNDVPDPVLLQLIEDAKVKVSSHINSRNSAKINDLILSAVEELMRYQTQSFENAQRKLLDRKVPIVFKKRTDLDVKLNHSNVSIKYTRGQLPPNYQWTQTNKPKIFSLSDSINFVDENTERYILFHGTSLKSLINMITKGILPIGGNMMGKGFYISADPNVPPTYAKMKSNPMWQKPGEINPAIIIRFSISPSKAKNMMGCIYNTKCTKKSLLFYQNNAYNQTHDFNLFKPESIKRLRMEEIIVYIDDESKHEEVKTIIKQAQENSRFEREVTSDSNANVKSKIKRQKK